MLGRFTQLLAGLVAALFLVSAVSAHSGGRPGGQQGGFGGPPPGNNRTAPTTNGSQPDFDGNGTRPGKPGPRNDTLTLPNGRLLSSVSVICLTAANATSSVESACYPVQGSNTTREEA